MADLCPVILAVVFCYCAALTGSIAGLLLRFVCTRNRMPTSAEAATCALMPLISVGILALAACLSPLTAGLPAELHHAWHQAADKVTTFPALHLSLHLANIAALILALIGLARVVFFASRRRAIALTLHGMSRPDATWRGLPVYRLTSDSPVCFSLGVLRPRVYAASGLLERLADRERDAVMAHEQAHVRRKDGLVGALMSTVYLLFPLPGAALLCREWRRAAERACDLAAAAEVGDPCDVASALVHVARMGLAPAVPGTASFAAQQSAEDVEGRVRALLDINPVTEDRAMRAPLYATVFLLACLLVALEPMLRHVVESFVYH
jgi:Zn-dependent protease with chaperone function